MIHVLPLVFSTIRKVNLPPQAHGNAVINAGSKYHGILSAVAEYESAHVSTYNGRHDPLTSSDMWDTRTILAAERRTRALRVFQGVIVLFPICCFKIAASGPKIVSQS